MEAWDKGPRVLGVTLANDFSGFKTLLIPLMGRQDQVCKRVHGVKKCHRKNSSTRERRGNGVRGDDVGEERHTKTVLGQTLKFCSLRFPES